MILKELSTYWFSSQGVIRPLATGNKDPPSFVYPSCVFLSLALVSASGSGWVAQWVLHTCFFRAITTGLMGFCLSVFVPGVVDLEGSGPDHSVHWEHLGVCGGLSCHRAEHLSPDVVWSGMLFSILLTKSPQRVPSACVISIQSAKSLSWCPCR